MAISPRNSTWLKRTLLLVTSAFEHAQTYYVTANGTVNRIPNSLRTQPIPTVYEQSSMVLCKLQQIQQVSSYIKITAKECSSFAVSFLDRRYPSVVSITSVSAPPPFVCNKGCAGDPLWQPGQLKRVWWQKTSQSTQ